MCGIAALALPHDAALLERLSDALAHRGPDDAGVHRDGDVSLVARRLSILDLEGGHQPMANGDGSLAIAFNGEIFNAPELRAELERDGVRFASDHSDTEVVLRLYERGGEFLPRLNGMFAFVIHDRRRRVLFGARDRFGIKPLYVARPDGKFAAASELRTLLLVPGVERELDPVALWHYVSLRFVPGGSPFRGVEQLPPAHAFRYDLAAESYKSWRWWQLAFGAEERDDWAERVRDALGRAVARWTLSDVPVAVSLSGGLDSSAVAALLAEVGHEVRTYTLGFTSADDESLNELPLARALAERYGTRHHELVVDAGELLGDLLQMVWALEAPYGGGLPAWYVFRFMAGDVKVGLTGTGGDELFGNYRRFVPFETARLARFRRSFAKYYFEPSYYFTDGQKAELLGVEGPSTAEWLENRYVQSGSDSARDSVLWLDTQTQLPDEFLHMTDRFSMRFSLEARTPFLDHELVELVARVPPAERTSAEDPKRLLRVAVGDLLPHAAPKRGFVFPLARWLRGELAPLVNRLLAPERLREQGLFRPDYPYASLDAERLWPLVMFQLWHLLYVEEALEAAPTFGWADVAGRRVVA